MKRLRLYADTSVFGGCFDDEFSESSRKLIAETRQGRFILVISATTLRELEPAPAEVRKLVTDLAPDLVEPLDPSEEIEELRDAYLKAGVVGPASLLDAEHIAGATVAGVDLIVSWNFKHIVNFEKIRGYHAVNFFRGYPAIPIYTPREVINS